MTAKKHKAISHTEAASSAITKFDKDMLQSLRAELTDAVGAVSQKHGLSLAFGKCTYTENNATMKLEMSVKTADGVVVTPEPEDYQQLPHLDNLKPEWI